MTAQTRLQVPYADTSARQLGFSLHAGLQQALARCDQVVGGRTISLRLLGASHQVVIDDGADRLCETVACLPGLDGHLPGRFEQRGYTFTSRIEPCDRTEMQNVVGELTRRCEAHRAVGAPAILGHFPGRPLAVTAVLANGELHVGTDDHTSCDVLRWETWHTYPQSAELVVTSSVLHLSSRVSR